VARNANEVMMMPMKEGIARVCVWRECGVWSQAVVFVLVGLAGI
jgi:hypothetical protein